MSGLTSPYLTIQKIQVESNENSHEKGYYDPPFVFLEQLCMIVEEIGECTDCFRKGDLKPRWGEGVDVLPEWEGNCLKPEGLPSEMADIIIGICDLAYEMGIHLDQAIEHKMNFNKKRNPLDKSRKNYIAKSYQKD